MFDIKRIFQYLDDRLHAGEAACLVTVTEVTGASVRNAGAHMAVSECGAYCGSLSGGCIEKAIVAEAREAMREGRPRQVAYGAGSPIVDIRLPCGGRVDLLLNPLRDAGVAHSLAEASQGREPWAIALPTGGGEVSLAPTARSGWQSDSFIVAHQPSLRVVIAGHGASVEALVRQARAMDIGCEVATPDPDIVRRLRVGSTAGEELSAHLLERLSDRIPAALDPWTACVFLFHDHDWETQLLSQVLASPAFYVGAMGSRKTHAARCELLAINGVGKDAIAAMDAPIGLIPSSRDPETLAISILAQVVDRYNALNI